MLTLKQTIEQDLHVIENDLGEQSFTWDGNDYVCIPAGSSQESALLSLGGFGGDTDSVVMVRKSLFADGVYPEKENIITMDGIAYEIDRISDDVTHTFLVLYLKFPAP
jgi:hypothetical protein